MNVRSHRRTSAPSVRLHAAIMTALIAALCATALPAAADDAPTADDSLAQFVPGDTSLFVEVKGLNDAGRLRDAALLNELLRVPGAAESDAPDTLIPWLGRVKAIANIERDELIRSYFGERVAVAAPSWERLSEGVIIARVPDAERIDKLFEQARGPVLPIEQDARVCSLSGRDDSLWLAAKDDIIVLGPNRNGESYFLHVADRLTGLRNNQSLWHDKSCRRLLAELPKDAQGWLFLRRVGAPPTPTVPGASLEDAAQQIVGGLLSRAQGLGASFQLRDGAIDVHAVGWGAGARPFMTSPGSDTLRSPKGTVAAWRFGYDYAAAARQAKTGQWPARVRFMLLLAQNAAPDVDLYEDVFAKLGPESAVFVGRSEARPPVQPFDVPTLAFAVRCKNEDGTLVAAQQLASRLAGICNFQTRRRGNTDDSLTIQRAVAHGVTIDRLPIGRFLANWTDCEYLRDLEIAWAVSDGWLLVGSHRDYLVDLIAAQKADPQAAAVAAALLNQPGESIEFHGTAAAEMIRQWLQYLEAAHPHMLEPGWWELVRQRRSGAAVQLGAGMKRDPDHPGKARVALTLEGWPAHGVLEVGDFITGVDGQLLSTADPIEDVKTLLINRKHLDFALLRIERNGRAKDVRIKLPPPPGQEQIVENPVLLLRPMARLLSTVDDATYRLQFQGPDRFKADLALRFAPATAESQNSVALRADTSSPQTQ